jgi:inorganic pyrophosphatase
VNAFIEITPFDTVKYEIDKLSGYLRVERPQHTSAQPPALYGFIPRTYCGSRVGELSVKAFEADNDPLDICVISERPITRPGVVLNVRVVGGIQLIDSGLADDKIIGILVNDALWSKIEDISELPAGLVERMKHYFSTYKLTPGREKDSWIERLYEKEHALKVVKAAMEDYNDQRDKS